MVASFHLIRVIAVSLLLGLRLGARIRKRLRKKSGLTIADSRISLNHTQPVSNFPNGLIPSEAGRSLAILISVGLCNEFPAVASAVAKACALAQVELWVATKGNMTCAFESEEIDSITKYIEAKDAEKAFFVRDFAPTMTVDPKTRKPVKAVSMPYKRGMDAFALAIHKYLQKRYKLGKDMHIRADFSADWGALVPDGEGLCFLSSLQDPTQMKQFLTSSTKICKEVIHVYGIDGPTGHADIAMAVPGPGSYLVSTPYQGTETNPIDLGIQAPSGVDRNMDRIGKIMQEREHLGRLLPFTYVLMSDIEPSTYANALVVTGPGGSYLVFPTYDNIYKFPEEARNLQDPENVHVKARSDAKTAWVEALKESLGIEHVGIIEVDASELYRQQGSIHCATKNYPVIPES